MLFQGGTGGLPDADDAADYAESIESPDFPVMSDLGSQVLVKTPYEGNPLPGTCALTPRMELLACSSGQGNEELFTAIREHAGLD